MSSTEEIVAQAVGATQDSPAENNDNQAEGSTFDLVKEVLEEQEVSPTSQTGDVEAQVEAQDAVADKVEEDPYTLSENDKKALSQKSQERFQKLVDRAKQYEGRAQELEPRAQNFDKIVEFSRKNNLSAEDIDNMFDIAAAIRNNPVEGFKKLIPIYQQLAQTVGAVLPPELEEQVRQGFISEANARELAQTKAQLNFKSVQEQEQLRRQELEQQQESTQRAVQLAVTTADNWRTAKAKNDPDWIMKQQRVADVTKLRLLESGKYPQTEAEVVALCEDALKQVEAEMKPLLGTRRAVTPVTSSSSSRSVPEPKSSLDVVKNVLSGMA